tara:strand:- start:104 stop:226 length:123 start_codon:yes stop_codon:yes gene_type:complete
MLVALLVAQVEQEHIVISQGQFYLTLEGVAEEVVAQVLEE